MGLIFNDDPIVSGEAKPRRFTASGLAAAYLILLVVGYFAAPYVPYPHRYCAAHPHNHNCIAYRPNLKEPR